MRQSHIIIRYINTRDNKKPYGNKDGYGWRRLTPIANDELDKFRLTFLGAGWTNSHAAPLKLLSATCGNATELESNVAICLIQFRNSLTGSFWCQVCKVFYCWFSRDVTKFQTSELLILLRFYFHDVLEQPKTNIQTNFHSKWVLGLVLDYSWISKLLRYVAFTWRARELLCWFKRWLISGNSAIWTVLVLE